MLSVVKSVGATVANGALPLVYQTREGFLTDVFAAGFRILDANLTQVYPVSGTQALNLVTSKVGTGRYNATWVSSAEVPTIPTRYFVRWYVTPASGDTEVVFDQEFELVIKAYSGPYYCFVSELRDEGLPASVTDVQAQAMAVRASKYVEWFTGRKFYPQYRSTDFDGKGSRGLVLDEPIVAVESVTVSFDSVLTDQEDLVDSTGYKVYNRHLTQHLTQPDDRDAPKIEFVHGDDAWGRNFAQMSIFADRVIWPTGVQNITIMGMFGYTDPDGSYVGKTPDMIRECAKMLVFQKLPRMVSGTAVAGPIIRERTRDQEVQFSSLRVTGLTGDRNIDVLLAGFRRPPVFGAA